MCYRKLTILKGKLDTSQIAGTLKNWDLYSQEWAEGQKERERKKEKYIKKERMKDRNIER